MVNEGLGMPDSRWRDHRAWNGCERNPYAGELQVGQAVRINYRDRATFSRQPIARIQKFLVVDGEIHADLRWNGGETRTVPRWVLIKV